RKPAGESWGEGPRGPPHQPVRGAMAPKGRTDGQGEKWENGQHIVISFFGNETERQQNSRHHRKKWRISVAPPVPNGQRQEDRQGQRQSKAHVKVQQKRLRLVPRGPLKVRLENDFPQI